MKDKRTKNNNLSSSSGVMTFVTPFMKRGNLENMIQESNKEWEQDYLIKTTETLQAVTDRRNASLEKNTKTVCDQTPADIEDTMTEG